MDNFVICFTSTSSYEKTDEYFARFCWENREELDYYGSGYCRFKDGTVVKRVYNEPMYLAAAGEFDQVIIDGPAAVVGICGSVIPKNIHWKNGKQIPIEYRVIHINEINL